MTPALPLLEKIFSEVEINEDIQQLRVLVICAGVFPSYFDLKNILAKKFPRVFTINFALVEPSSYKTNLFMNAIKNTHFNDHFECHHLTLQKFLQKKQSTFDIIYLEHPDLRTITIPLAKLTSAYQNTVSLRDSIGYLGAVCKRNTLIIASNMSKHENIQLKYLLKYSLKTRSKIINLSHLDSSAFRFGLYSVIKKLPIQHSKGILWNDGFLVFFTISFIIFYSVIAYHSKSLTSLTIPILLFIIAYRYHRPGICGMLMVFLCQLIIIYFALPGVLAIF
jgi:hypothetical protein